MPSHLKAVSVLATTAPVAQNLSFDGDFIERDVQKLRSCGPWAVLSCMFRLTTKLVHANRVTDVQQHSRNNLPTRAREGPWLIGPPTQHTEFACSALESLVRP
jgi:hypothetical protein